MALLNITQARKASKHQSGGSPSPTRSITKGPHEDVDFTSAEAKATAISEGRYSARLCPDTTCRVLVNGTATANTGTRLIANSAEWIDVYPGDIISVIAE